MHSPQCNGSSVFRLLAPKERGHSLLQNGYLATATLFPLPPIPAAETSSIWRRIGESATSYTDFPDFFFGKTTLTEIKSRLGNDNFAWNGGPMPDRSLVTQNSYRINPTNVIVTFTTKLSTSDQAKLRGGTGATGVLPFFRLVAISLGDYAYLSSIWGQEHLPKPNARKVRLASLQPTSSPDIATEKGNKSRYGGTAH